MITRLAILLMFFLVLLFAYDFLGSVILKMKKAISAVLFVITLFIFCFSANCSEAFNDKILDVSPSVLMCIDAVLLTAGLLMLLQIKKRKATSLTAMSVKECVDSLPTGICYYNGNGLPILKNTVMERICCDVLGVYLSDGKALWNAVSDKNELSEQFGRSGSFVKLSDGKVYNFIRYESDIEGRKFYELIASEMTSEYTLTQELREKQAHADSINRRLHDLSRSIGEAIKERELLQIKISIHDGFGKMLLLTKRALLVENSVGQDELFRLWKRNTMLFSNVQSERTSVRYETTLRRAEELGVCVKISGMNLPGTPELAELINEAITVHVTNVLRHAHGSTAFIDVSLNDNKYELRFANDGAQTENIREKGGLVNLRRMTESRGGTMEITNGGRFEMILRLPLSKGDTGNGLPRSDS